MVEKKEKCCSFCKRKRSEVDNMIEGLEVTICDICLTDFEKIISNSADGVIRPTFNKQGTKS